LTDVSLTAADENAPHGRKCEPLGLQGIMPEAWRLASGLVKRKNRQALNRNRIKNRYRNRVESETEPSRPANAGILVQADKPPVSFIGSM
jgi:hypothetical protein